MRGVGRLQKILVILGNAASGPLGEFVVAEQEVDAVGILALQRGSDVEQLVRALPAERIRERAVDDLLQNEVPARMLRPDPGPPARPPALRAPAEERGRRRLSVRGHLR